MNGSSTVKKAIGKNSSKAALTMAVLLVCVVALSACGGLDKTYTIVFNANGGEGVMEDFVVPKEKTGSLPPCKFTKEGYESLYWSTDANGEHLYGNYNSLVFPKGLTRTVKNNSRVELFAIWTTPGFRFAMYGTGFFMDNYFTGYSGTAKDVIIPVFYNGYAIEGFDEPVFAGHKEIESIKNFSFDVIGSRLFYGCTSLQTVEMRKEIKYIGIEAFSRCSAMEKIVIPSSVTFIGEKAFFGWTENQTIEFTGHSENIFGDDWLIGCSAKIIWAA